MLLYRLNSETGLFMGAIEKLSITLPKEMASEIRARVEGGRYASTSEVLREAMRLWLRREAEAEERIAAIRGQVKRSLEDPRPNLTGEEMRERLARLYAGSQAREE